MQRIVIFIALTTLLSAPLWWLARQSGFYTVLLMWCPGLAAMATLKLTGGALAELGWRGADLKWIVSGWLITIAYWAVAYAAVAALGVAGFPDAAALGKIAKQSFLVSDAPPAIALIVVGSYAATAGVVDGIGRALGEELGWRGLLTPEACARFGFLPGALWVGLVWGLWHLPLLIGQTPVSGIVDFMLLVVGVSVLYAWMRLRSESVWPSTLMHALHNALRSGLFGVLSFNTATTSPLWLGETGYALAAAGILLAAVFGALGTSRQIGVATTPGA
jgi:membrane protease YdiL (CAAX protease family)